MFYARLQTSLPLLSLGTNLIIPFSFLKAMILLFWHTQCLTFTFVGFEVTSAKYKWNILKSDVCLWNLTHHCQILTLRDWRICYIAAQKELSFPLPYPQSPFHASTYQRREAMPLFFDAYVYLCTCTCFSGSKWTYLRQGGWSDTDEVVFVQSRQQRVILAWKMSLRFAPAQNAF